MGEAGSERNLEEEVEAALLDADLFLKYRAPHRAVERLREAVSSQPRSTRLREKLREVALAARQPDEAARQCLALAGLYIAREEFEAAHDRLLQAKQIDPRISIATGLEAIRRARRPDLHAAPAQTPAPQPQTHAAARPATLAGDLSVVSIFDVVQVLENARLTGALAVAGADRRGRVLFNEGQIVGAEAGDAEPLDAFRRLLELTSGSFDFERAPQPFPPTIKAPSNTSLILDSLREIDEGKQ